MNARGTTLIELAIVLAIGGILAAFLAPMTYMAMTAYNTTGAGLDALYKLRFALDRVAHEAREIRRLPTDTRSYDVIGAATTLTLTRSDATQVAITCSSATGPTLSMQYGAAAAATLSDEVSACGFSYFQTNGVTASTTTANLAYVLFSLSITRDGNVYSGTRRIDVKAAP